ncbi:hypothetical protein CK203_093976 [Vitis vinifera]|uniref:Uncharacterized protein n=1 Tax=Vitis vinifera TaxID=29760 RepID=A0A438CK87_VITVI|nr:hypothetical protein CK203_093976 [Vitis vinifera]
MIQGSISFLEAQVKVDSPFIIHQCIPVSGGITEFQHMTLSRRNCKENEGSCETPLWHQVPFRSTVTPFRSCEMASKSPKREISNFRSPHPFRRRRAKPEQPSIFSLHLNLSRLHLRHLLRPAMARTEELSPRLRQAARELHQRPCSRLHIRAFATTAHPTSSWGRMMSPPVRRYQTRASSQPPRKKPRCPMLTQPPIEGNLDYRARPFHSSSVLMQPLSDFSPSSGLLPSAPEVSYGAFADSQGFFLSPCSNGFYQSMTTHHVEMPTVIHFTIDGRHEYSGSRHIAEALRISYEQPVQRIIEYGLSLPRAR